MTVAPYVSVSTLRSTFRELSDDTMYPDELLSGLVTEFEKKLEDDKGYAMVRRTVTGERHKRRQSIDALILDHIAVVGSTVVLSIDDRAIAATRYEVDEAAGIIEFETLIGPGTFEVDYTHGLDGTEPGATRACGLYVWREALAQKNPNTGNAYLVTNNELGIVERESTADPERGRLTGWLDVDRICRGIRNRRDHAVHGR